MKTLTLEVRQFTNNEGQLIREIFLLNVKYHNPHGPAFRVWNDAGQLVDEEYYLDGKPHNPHGPAYCAWNDDGQLIQEEYLLDGKLHNLHGPAIRRWDDDGQLIHESYYFNGKEVDSLPDSCEGKTTDKYGEMCGEKRSTQDRGKWTVVNSFHKGKAILESDDFSFDARIAISGDFTDEQEKVSYAQNICDRLNSTIPEDH